MQHSEPNVDLVIRCAVVFDGSGGSPRIADVAIDEGRVVAVGDHLEVDGRDEVDATGLALMPGIVDIHTHYDAQLLWDPAATPSSLHGVTTVIGGNCGFSIAPLDGDQGPYLAAMLARVEGIPLDALHEGTDWGWRSFAEYLDRFEGNLAINAGFLAGHTTMRRCVMGADDERPASADEVAAMETLLRASLSAGAIGFSSSLASTHNDANGRAVSSRYADRDELVHLARVTGEYPGTTLEFIPSISLTFDDDAVELMTAMSVAADRPLNWNILNVNTALWEGSRQRLEAADRVEAAGGRIVALTMPMSSTLRVNFVSGFVLDTFIGWTDLFTMTLDDRRAEMARPERREAMRAGVESAESMLTKRVRDWGALVVGETFTRATDHYAGRTLGDITSSDGGDPFELMLDIALADDLRTIFVIPPIGNDPESWELRRRVWADPRAVIGGSDSGAHLDLIDTFLYATAFLGPIVRDGHIELAEAVRLLTDAPARLYGIVDRGRIEVGAHADLVLFDPATIGPGPVHTRDDLPAGASRLYAEATGIHRVFVNGTEIARDGELTGARPGTVLRSGDATRTVHAQTAAEAS